MTAPENAPYDDWCFLLLPLKGRLQLAVLPINDNTPVSRYTVSGSPQTVFPFAYWVDTEDSLNVYVNGVLKTLNVDYTVQGLQQDAGGTITLTTPVTSGTSVVIERSTKRRRLTGLTTNGKFDADTINLDFTRLIAMQQEVNTRLDRGVQFPVTANVPANGAVLPTPVANNLIGWNATATGLENKSSISGVALPGFTGNARRFVRVNPQANNLDYQDDATVATQLFSPVRCLVASVDTSTETLTTDVAHGLSTGASVRLRAVDGGVLPAPTSANGYYNVRSMASNQLRLFNSALDAGNNFNQIDLTSVGSGRIEIISDPVSPVNGQIWVSDGLNVRMNNNTLNLADANTGVTLPSGHRDVATPQYINSTTFSVARFVCRDSSNLKNISKLISTTVDISNNGLNGIPAGNIFNGTVAITNASPTVTGTGTFFQGDFVVGDVITVSGQARRIISIPSQTSMTVNANFTSTLSGQSYLRGGRAPSTWYNLYEVTDGVNAALVLSTRNVSAGQALTDQLPGYNYSRQERFALRLDSSANILPFVVVNFAGAPEIYWRDFEEVAAYQPLNAGAATSFTAVDCSQYMPPISRMGIFCGLSGSGTVDTVVRATGSALTTGVRLGGSAPFAHSQQKVLTSSAQSIDYKIGGTGSLSIYAQGFVVTEV